MLPPLLGARLPQGSRGFGKDSGHGMAKGLAVGVSLIRCIGFMCIGLRALSNTSGIGSSLGPSLGDSWTQRWGFGGATVASD